MFNRLRYWFLERVLKQSEKIIHRVRTGETPQAEHQREVKENSFDFLKVIGALILGVLQGWVQHRGATPAKQNRVVATGKIPPSRSLVPASQTPQAILSGNAPPRKHPLERKKKFSFTPGRIFALLKDTVKEWTEDKAPQLAAALAYYTIFSIAPLLIIVIAIAGLVFGQQAAENQIVGQLSGMIGTQGAQFIQSMIQSASKPAEGTLATVLSVVALLGGAIGLVGQLKAALNTIWNAQPKPGPGGIKGILVGLRQQLLSLGLVLGIGFILLVSLVLSAGLAAIGTLYNNLVPGWAFEIINFVLSFAVITLLFASIYKVLPDVEIAWRDVWIGAAITALLFTIGKWALGLYLGRSGVTSTYGAAGSLVLILLWIYYSAQILFFGAELTQVYANQYGTRIVSEADVKSTNTGKATASSSPAPSGQTRDRRAA